MRPASSAVLSGSVTCSCPTTSANVAGRYFRYRATGRGYRRGQTSGDPTEPHETWPRPVPLLECCIATAGDRGEGVEMNRSWLEPTVEVRGKAAMPAEDPEPDRVGERLDELPEFVFVPAHPAIDKPLGSIEIEMFTLRSAGETIAVAFSTVELLAARLGNAQPWIRLAAINFQRSVIRAGVPGIILDPAEKLLRPRWTPGALRALTEVIGG